jgi:hypothetical protein
MVNEIAEQHWAPQVSPALRVVTLLLTLLLCAGCGSGDVQSYSPSTDRARLAIEAALDAWKRGEPPGPITGGSTAIEVADSNRPAGRKLAGYEITAESPGEGAAKHFSVRLQLENPTQVQETQYVVVGRDPIWVFGHADYAQEKGM